MKREAGKSMALREVFAALCLAPLLLSTSACRNREPVDNADGGVGDGGSIFGDDGGLQECASSTAKAELAPLDIFIALDTSFSMDFENKWIAVSAALDSFVTNNTSAQGLGLGLQYFPLRAQCNVDQYSVPAVEFEEFPSVAAKISASLAGQQMYGGTPIVQILEGAIAYTQAWRTLHPERKTAILLATDGVPDDTCPVATMPRLPNSIGNAITLAGQSKDGSVPVFVIGVGADLDALNQIAAAGGSTQALFVETNANAEQAFLTALNQIRGNAVSCDFAIPQVPGQTIDYSRVNVVFKANASAAGETFVSVAGAGDCGQAGGKGWYYDDPNLPTKVLLCPDTCHAVSAAGQGQVDVVFGCSTIVL